MRFIGFDRSSNVDTLWKLQVEVRERERRRAAKQAHVVIHAIILGVNLGWGVGVGVKNMKQNPFAESGEGALPCDAKGLCGSRETLLRMRRGAGSSQTEQPRRDSAVPGKN